MASDEPLSDRTLENGRAVVAQPDQKIAPKPHRDFHDWAMLVLIFGAFAAAAVAAIFTGWSAITADKALVATKTALKSTEKTAVARLRAYISVRVFNEI